VQHSALERQLDARIIVVVHFKTRFIGGAVARARGAKLMEESQYCDDERKGMSITCCG
jgi:acetyl-CoA carboxylase beta subunit